MTQQAKAVVVCGMHEEGQVTCEFPYNNTPSQLPGQQETNSAALIKSPSIQKRRLLQARQGKDTCAPHLKLCASERHIVQHHQAGRGVHNITKEQL
jgi:hypothetical protein